MHHRLKGAALLRLLALVLPLGSALAQTGMSTPGQFSVNESGAATYTIPLTIPPGIGGIEPKLALSYNSQAGNGLLGVGWSLSGLSAIGRCPQTMAQDGKRGGVKLDNEDRYCLDGQRLMAINGAYGADGTEYRTERESFSKIISYGVAGNGPAWFKVWTKAGQVMEYGNTADSRIEAIKAAGSTATWPTGTVRQWALNKLSDTKGNYFKVSYTEDQVNGDYYPKRIDYTGNDSTNTATTNAVVFEYEARPDSDQAYLTGASSKNVSRLKKISSLKEDLVTQSYVLEYEQSLATSFSRLVKIAECSANNVCKPSSSLAWLDAAPSFVTKLNSLSGAWNLGAPLVWELFAADINGDGKTDFVGFRGAEYISAISNGDGGLDFSLKTLPNGWSLGVPLVWQLYPADVNGDGKTDFVGFRGTEYISALSNGDGSLNFSINTLPGGANLGVSLVWQLYSGDFNGDGRTDFMGFRGTEYFSALSNGDGSLDFSFKSLPNGWSLGVPLVWQLYSGDVNGDGKTDFVGFRGTEYISALSNGDGSLNFSINTLPGGANLGVPLVWQLYSGDFNGDGKTDFMGFRGAEYFSALSMGDGNLNFSFKALPSGWSLGTPLVWQLYQADINGDGKTDFVGFRGTEYISAVSGGDGALNFSLKTLPSGWNLGAPLVWQLYGGDFNGDGRPDFMGFRGTEYFSHESVFAVSDLLKQKSAGLNDVTAMSYVPLSANTTYTKDVGSNASTYPKLDIQAPMYVVSSVSSPNGVGGTVTTNYKYGGLKAEQGTGRGMLGFRWLEATQVETGMVTRTEFKQDWPYTGLVSKTQKSLAGAGNNGLLSQVDNTYGCTDFVSSTGCTTGTGKRYYVYGSQSTESSWDANGAALPTIITASQYDIWGNATQVSVSSSDGYSKVTNNSYSNDVGNWYLGRLNKASVTSTAP